MEEKYFTKFNHINHYVHSIECSVPRNAAGFVQNDGRGTGCVQGESAMLALQLANFEDSKAAVERTKTKAEHKKGSDNVNFIAKIFIYLQWHCCACAIKCFSNFF